MVLGTSRSLWV